MNKRLIYIFSTVSYFICLLGIQQLKDLFGNNTYLYFSYFFFSLIFIYLLYRKYSNHQDKWTVFETVISIIIFDFSSFIYLANYTGINYYINFLFITLLTVFYYLYVASANIFLVSLNKKKRLSLLEPATLFLFIGQVLTLFFVLNWIYTFVDIFSEIGWLNLVVKMVFIFLLYLYLFNLEFSHPNVLINTDKYKTEYFKKINILNSVRYSAIYLNTFLAIIITFYPFSNYWREIFLTIVFYMSFNYINLYLNNRLGNKYIINSGIIFFAVLILILTI